MDYSPNFSPVSDRSDSYVYRNNIYFAFVYDNLLFLLLILFLFFLFFFFCLGVFFATSRALLWLPTSLCRIFLLLPLLFLCRFWFFFIIIIIIFIFFFFIFFLIKFWNYIFAFRSHSRSSTPTLAFFDPSSTSTPISFDANNM